MFKLIKGLLESKSTKQSPNITPLTSMTSTNKFGFIKGLVRFRHTIASAFVIIPKATHGIISPISTDGIGLVSKLTLSTALLSPIAGTHSLISPLNSRGKGLNSPITTDGIGLLSSIKEPG